MVDINESAKNTLYGAVIIFLSFLFILYLSAKEKSIEALKNYSICLSIIIPALILCVIILIWLLINKLDEHGGIIRSALRDNSREYDANRIFPAISEDIDKDPGQKVTRVICPMCKASKEYKDLKRPCELVCFRCNAKLIVNK